MQCSWTKFLFVCVFVVASLSTLRAQDPIYSQFYHSTLQLNPGLAGLSDGARFALNYRSQWPLVVDGSTSYTTYTATYDQYFSKYSSGIGFMIQGDDAGGGLVGTTKLSLFYSYNLKVQEGLYLKSGIEAGVLQTRFAWDKFIFGDQLDPRFGSMTGGGITIPTAEVQPEDDSKTSFDASFGMVLYSERFYFGAALKHLNRPDISILGVNTDAFDGLPLRWSFHGGYQFPISGDGSYIMPNLLYVRQGDFSQLNAGAHVSIGALFFGLWYRNAGQNADAVIASVGAKKGKFKVGYSYDYTISDLGIQNGGAHELSLIINLKEGINERDFNDCFQFFR